MGATLKVDFDGLGEAVSRLTRAQEAIGGILDALDSEVKTLRARWTGEASDAYDSAQSELSSGLREANDQLAAAAAGILRANERYRKAEATNAAHWPG